MWEVVHLVGSGGAGVDYFVGGVLRVFGVSSRR